MRGLHLVQWCSLAPWVALAENRNRLLVAKSSLFSRRPGEERQHSVIQAVSKKDGSDRAPRGHSMDSEKFLTSPCPLSS